MTKEELIEKYSKWFPYCEIEKLKEGMRQDLSAIAGPTSKNSDQKERSRFQRDIDDCYANEDEE